MSRESHEIGVDRRAACVVVAMAAPLLAVGAIAPSEAKENHMYDIENRLHALEARAAIEELRNRYAWCAMRGDAAGVAATFTEDGIFDSPAGPGKRAVVQGHKNLLAFLQPKIGTVAATLPLIHNHLTEVTSSDTAKGSCVMEAPMAPGYGHLIGQYHEDLQRVDSNWLFKVRRLYLFVPSWEAMPT